MISTVAKVVVPVGDQQAALEFWTERAGFGVVQDESYGDERWFEVAPREGGPLLVLSPRPSDQIRPDVPDLLPHSPVMFTCADIRATYEEMRGRGVRFTSPPAQMNFGWWALFADQEGTRYALGVWERGT